MTINTGAGWLAARFADGPARDAAVYLLRASGYLSGRVSPEKLLDFATGGDLERTLIALRAAIDADPQGARAAAAEVLDEIVRRATAPAAGGGRRNAPTPATGSPRPPSAKQMTFLADLGHPNPHVIRTSSEAHREIQKLLARQGQGGRR